MLAAIAFPPFLKPNLIEWPIPVKWYGLAYVGGLLFAAWYIKRLVSKPALWGKWKPAMTPLQVDEMFVWFFLGVVGGGRLGYVLLYQPAKYLADPLGIFKVWDGGMSFHGGFLGVVIACYFYGRKVGATLDRMLDLGAAAVPVGLGLGRLANFINAELYGRYTDVPWAVIFPGDTQGRHPSQLYEAGLEGIVLFLILRLATHRFHLLPRRGAVTGLFMACYGLFRIMLETVRNPDLNMPNYPFGLTMGMILSTPMVLAGLALFWYASRPLDGEAEAVAAPDAPAI